MKKWSTGKILAVVFGSLAGVTIAGIAFIISVYNLSDTLLKAAREQERAEVEEMPEDSGFEGYADEPDKEEETEDKESETEYYEFQDDIHKDLPYEIRFSNFSPTIRSEGKASVSISYPVVYSDNNENIQRINDAIQEELQVIEAYVTENAEALSSADTYQFAGEAYVTYMSEEILSVAYLEYGYLNDTRVESYVESVNIDMETGMKLTNTQLLEIDDAFSIDFRERSNKQNGENESLNQLTDQQITQLLTDEDRLIIFYTPLGMEVGFNYYVGYDSGWVTVTYRDYKDFERKF